MKTIPVKLKTDPKKYEAAQQFMAEKGLDIEEELSKTVEDFYKKYVPAPVRKYIEKTSSTALSPAAKPSPSAPQEPPESGSCEPNSGQNSHILCSCGSNGV